MDDEAGHSAVRHRDPGQVTVEASGASRGFQPEIEEPKTRHRHFLWKQSRRLARGFVLGQDRFLDRNHQYRVSVMVGMTRRKNLPVELGSGQRQSLLLSEPPPDEGFLLFASGWHLFHPK